VQQRRRQANASAIALGERLDRAVDGVAKARVLGGAADSMTRGLPAHAARLGYKAQEAPRRHLAIERRAFGQIAHAFLRAAAILRHIDVEDFRDAFVGFEVTGDHSHCGRLAGAVRPQETDDLSDVERETDAVHRGAPAKGFAQTIDLQQHVD